MKNKKIFVVLVFVSILFCFCKTNSTNHTDSNIPRTVVCAYDSLVEGYQITITMTEDSTDVFTSYVQAVISLTDSIGQCFTINTPMEVDFCKLLYPDNNGRCENIETHEKAFAMDTIRLTSEKNSIDNSLFCSYGRGFSLTFADIDYDGQKEILISNPYPSDPYWVAMYIYDQFLIFKRVGDSFTSYSFDDFLGEGASENTRSEFFPERKIIALSYRGENINIYQKNPNSTMFDLKRVAWNVRYDDTIFIYRYEGDSCILERQLLNPDQVYYWQKYDEIHEILMEGL